VDSNVSSTQEAVIKYVDDALKYDDVFCLRFLNYIFLCGSFQVHSNPDVEILNLPKSWNTTSVQCIKSNRTGLISFGPHMLKNGKLWNVYRLYNDSVNAFTVPFKPTEFPEDAITSLSVQSPQHSIRSIAVQSRLHCSPTLPLSGMRIAVKDMFHIKGNRNSLGSRAYLELYPKAKTTAPAIQRLIDKGAAIVGFTQLCSMMGTTDPTQCIDFQAPFNPRGDGYQSPSGGSNGQSSAIAAYEWLDIAIGSDCRSV